MSETVEVLAVSGSRLTVRCAPAAACSACASVFCSPRTRTYDATFDPHRYPQIRPGSRVEVDPSSGPAKGIVLFGMPLVLFAAAYLGLSPTGSEVIQAAGGFAGLAVGLLAAVGAARIWRDPDPRVVRVYDSPSGPPVTSA